LGREKSDKSLWPLTLLVVEGDTEKIFYEIIQGKEFPKLGAKIENAHGQGNILKTVLGKTQPPFVTSGQKIRVYCCVDNEGDEVPDFDLEAVRGAVRKEERRNILSVDAIIANTMIESWFFYDSEGIYNFLQVPKGKRKPKEKYNTPHNCTKRDLKNLFKEHDKYYHAGKRATNFIKSLSLGKLTSSCEELGEGIKLIKSQANDLTNHLFPSRKRKKK